MKEEAKGKKLPPKRIVGGSTSSTPTKVQNDEIFGALLRINNFDSISSLKDESLDIDLSACVTICADTSAMINSNSLSSTDFWRVLDESAQNPQLDLNGSDDSLSSIIATTTSGMPKYNVNTSNPVGGVTIKEEKVNTFSGTFLRPEAPVTSSPSPFKKSRTLPAESGHHHHHQHQPPPPQIKAIHSALMTSPTKSFRTDGKLRHTSSYTIKEEPLDQDDENATTSTALSKPMPAESNFRLNITTVDAAAPVAETTPVTNTEPVEAAVTSEPLYKCLDCDEVLHGKEEYTTHHMLNHRILYKCNMCERDFEQESGLKKHLKTHRSGDARKDVWRKCPDCGKCLKLGSLWMHRKIHSENKKYGCDICGQKFVQKINLTHHSRVHITEKPYECPECQKRFQERSHLQRHQKYHAQTRSYRCDKCGKMYKTERCLKVHALVHLEQRPFACNLCDKSFISNSKLKQHSNIHTGNRPFKCNYCPRDFTNFPNWLKHTRRRHKVDHKTGEHLENIPSYCSKKSTKSAKKQEPPPAATTTNTTVPVQQQQQQQQQLQQQNPQLTLTTTPLEAISSATTNVMPDKQTNGAVGKKKVPIVTVEKPKMPPVVVVNALNNNVQPQTTRVTLPKNTIPTITTKQVKLKRERKQPMPKQVQKTNNALLTTIKKETIDPKPANSKPKQQQPQSSTTFPDLHCLSLTSAEDLIMEQALEMEESGLYHNPSTMTESVDTDNAISADSAAVAMCFKIKSEFNTDEQQDEEFISLEEANNCNVLCSSLESSPFSSPASLEVASSVLHDTNSTASAILAQDFSLPSARTTTTTTYYLPANFPINVQAEQVRNLRQTQTNSLTLNQPLMQRQNAEMHATLNNSIYFPMAMTMPLLQQNQMLPSVDTLLASNSSAGNTKFFKGKCVGQAQHNLS